MNIEDNQKEYGGYFSLELGNMGMEDNEPFKNIEEKDIVRFNAARYAICHAVNEGHYNKIYIPIYMCESIGIALNEQGISFEVYNITEDFYPILDGVMDNECVMICNFFGIQGESFYKKCMEKFKNIIFDNTQSFYTKPIIQEGVCCIYSARKFVGVPDGAYLIKKDIHKPDIKISNSSEACEFLLKSIEGGTNYGYDSYLKYEKKIHNDGMMRMSVLTRKILSSINYEVLKKKRNNNFCEMIKLLEPYNKLKVIYSPDIYPMVYPLLIENEKVRSFLIQNRVYIPQWWKWVIQTSEANGFEKKLSRFVLPLPIDHRYSVNDMKAIAEIVIENNN